MQAELKRIARKARRFASRHKSLNKKPADFGIESAHRAGIFLKSCEHIFTR